MPHKDSKPSGKTQPLSSNLRVRKLLLTVASSRKRWRRDWQARADWLMSRAIELSWMGRLAAYHRAQRTFRDLKDWREAWERDGDGLPVSSDRNALVALREHPLLAGRLILVDGALIVIGDGGARRPFTHDDLARTIAFLQKLGLMDLSDDDCLRALAIVAAENRENGNG